MDSKPELLINIVTDVICPWCFIGARRFKQFLESDDYKTQIAPHVRTVVKIDPYILDPRLPATDYETPQGIYDAIESTPYEKNKPPTKSFYYRSKFGAGMDAFDKKIQAAAAEVGVPPFEWHSEGKVGATWDAHRLVWKASQQQQQQQQQEAGAIGADARLMDRMYEDYHCHSKDMSDRSYLAALAVEFGLFAQAADAAKWLETDEGEYELRHKLQLAEMNGVRSIPFYIVNDGTDHMSETGSHQSFLKMFEMAVAPYVR